MSVYGLSQGYQGPGYEFDGSGDRAQVARLSYSGKVFLHASKGLEHEVLGPIFGRQPPERRYFLDIVRFCPAFRKDQVRRLHVSRNGLLLHPVTRIVVFKCPFCSIVVQPCIPRRILIPLGVPGSFEDDASEGRDRQVPDVSPRSGGDGEIRADGISGSV